MLIFIDTNYTMLILQTWVSLHVNWRRSHDETKHVDFRTLTLWILAHVQESPLDKIYVLLMIFIGPLAQCSGKLPKNLEDSCFQLVVRMQSVIKFREAWWKLKYIYPGTRSQPTFWLWFPWPFSLCGYRIRFIRVYSFLGSFYKILKTAALSICVIFSCVVCLQNVI